ncbi:hypothetical protein CI109_105129 [Kwoniella shandongensis]|uniref:Uncharacterized protein n=1 Tax=Kwoniella shandongensis TaxID=1734106 RepID=A0A5M6C3L9_9TREE|nr:uncharacterized protein CI109_001968 [Kwoniella shandongensis]KAA5529543.1 hypothetical protein CI109_001968 [Kwoniella shandongensis]
MFAPQQQELCFLSAREKMQIAKIALIEAEMEEAEAKKMRKSQSRKKSYALSLDGSDMDSELAFASSSTHSRSSSSRSVPTSKSILRRPISTSTQPQSPASSSVSSLALPVPSAPLPPAPTSNPPNTDFGPSISPGTYASGSGGSTITPLQLRRRSSRVRFSDQESVGSPQPNLTTPSIGRPTSQRALRRESSIDGLRSDLALATGSVRQRSSVASRSSVVSRASVASSIASDPWAWRSNSIVSSRLSVGSSPDEESVEEAFKPQALPYPKIPPALSRLSVETSASSEWSDSPGNASPESVASPTLKQTLERSSLGSVHVPIKSLPSLDARLAGSDGSLYYAPSYISNGSSLDIDQDIEFERSNDSTSSSFSIQLPPRSYPSPYAALLPRRRSSLAAHVVSANLPSMINRGEWHDSELSLSPRSEPKMLEVQAAGRRKSSLATESITADSQQEQDLKAVEISIPSRMDSIDLLPSSVISSTDRGHKRSDSALSAIMAFPIPPDRVTETEVKYFSGPQMMAEMSSVPASVNRVEKTAVVEVDGVVVIDKEEDHVQAEAEEFIIPVEQASESGEPDEALGMMDGEILLNPPCLEAAPVHVVRTADVEIVDQYEADIEVSNAVRPPSPEVRQLLTSLPRPKRVRRSAIDPGLETEESDIDLSTPLITAALRSKILTPRSRLVNQQLTLRRPTQSRSSSSNSVNSESLKTGMGLTSGRGWSGSESEEEEWVSAVRSVSQRKAASRSPPLLNLESTPTSNRFSSASYASSSQSVSTGKSTNNRLSQLSTLSGVSTIEIDLGPLTPATSINMDDLTPQVMRRTNSTSSTASSLPGDFPWGQSSPPASPIRGLFASSPSSRKSSKDSFPFPGTSSPLRTPTRMKSPRTLPPPKNEVEGWGEPEVLMDDRDWDEDILSRSTSASGGSWKRTSSLVDTDDEDQDGSSYRSTRPNMGSRTESDQKTPKAKQGERAASPDVWAAAEEESLMEEKMPEVEVKKPVLRPRQSFLRQPTQIRIRNVTG